MEDYDINILRRNGNWKKVKPNDLIIDEINSELMEDNFSNKNKSQGDFISYVNNVESIISRLEALENENWIYQYHLNIAHLHLLHCNIW